MSSDLSLARPSGYARHLATYIKCPSTIRVRTLEQFGQGPSLERCRKYRVEVEEREARETKARSFGRPPLFACGHERSVENVLERDGIERCKTCRSETEREAAKRRRETSLKQSPGTALDKVEVRLVGSPGHLTPGELIQLAARIFNTTAADIRSDSRYTEHIVARAAVATVLNAERGMSMPAIGRLLGGRDHSTIHNAISKLPGYVNRKPALADAVEALANAARPA